MAFGDRKKKIGDQLIEAGLLSRKQMESVILEQKNNHMGMIDTIMAMGLVSDEDLAKFMHENQGYELATDDDMKSADSQAIAAVGDDLVRKHEVIPLCFENGKYMKVAMSDPTNLAVLDDLEMISGMTVIPYYAPKRMIIVYLDKMYSR